jgi:hypothetical protein
MWIGTFDTNTGVEMLFDRMRGVQIESLPVDDILVRYDSFRTFFLVRLPDAAPGIEDEKWIRLMLKVHGKVLLLGRRGVIGHEYLHGWRQEVRQPSAGSEHEADVAWMNYPDLRHLN